MLLLIEQGRRLHTNMAKLTCVWTQLLEMLPGVPYLYDGRDQDMNSKIDFANLDGFQYITVLFCQALEVKWSHI